METDHVVTEYIKVCLITLSTWESIGDNLFTGKC